MGHVHLTVGDIPAARAFPVDTLGFEVTADTGSALFAAAGGHHHHMAVDTWQSAGAGPRAAAPGLGQVSTTVPRREHLTTLAARLDEHRAAFRDDGRTVRFEDPWEGLLEVSAADAT